MRIGVTVALVAFATPASAAGAQGGAELVGPGVVSGRGYAYAPALSPDGRWLYFCRLGSDGRTSEVFRISTAAVGIPARQR